MDYKWGILKHEVVFQGYFRLEKYSLKHEKYEGDWMGEFQTEIFERGSVDAVVPYDPLQNKVVLIEQFTNSDTLRTRKVSRKLRPYQLSGTYVSGRTV